MVSPDPLLGARKTEYSDRLARKQQRHHQRRCRSEPLAVAQRCHLRMAIGIGQHHRAALAQGLEISGTSGNISLDTGHIRHVRWMGTHDDPHVEVGVDVRVTRAAVREVFMQLAHHVRDHLGHSVGGPDASGDAVEKPEAMLPLHQLPFGFALFGNILNGTDGVFRAPHRIPGDLGTRVHVPQRAIGPDDPDIEIEGDAGLQCIVKPGGELGAILGVNQLQQEARRDRSGSLFQTQNAIHLGRPFRVSILQIQFPAPDSRHFLGRGKRRLAALDLVFRLFPQGDIGNRSDHADSLPALAPHDVAAIGDEAIRLIGAAETIDLGPDLDESIEGRLQAGNNALAVVRMDPVAPPGTGGIRILIAEDPAEPFVPDPAVLQDVALVDDFARGTRQQPVAGLTLG